MKLIASLVIILVSKNMQLEHYCKVIRIKAAEEFGNGR